VSSCGFVKSQIIVSRSAQVEWKRKRRINKALSHAELSENAEKGHVGFVKKL
jgi:hypothetical protein